MSLLVRQHHEQNLKTVIDDGRSQGRKFQGLEDIAKAVEVSPFMFLKHIYFGISVLVIYLPFAI